MAQALSEMQQQREEAAMVLEEENSGSFSNSKVIFQNYLK